MRIRFFSAAILVFAAGAVLCFADDFNEHFLAAGCSGKNLKIVNTANGPAVEAATDTVGSTVLYCNLDAEDKSFYNWLQLIALDDTPNGAITATLYRQGLNGEPPEERLSVITTDQAGIQVASKFVPGFSFHEYGYHYYVIITLSRTAAGGTLRAYAARTMDVF
jgi:hypothetical protein